MDQQLNRTGRRALGIALVGGLLVAATIVSDPRDTSAAGDAGDEWLSASNFPKMGELIGRNYVLHLFAAPEGTLYTVCSPSGDVLAQDLTGEEVMRVFPDLDVNLHAGPDNLGVDGADFVIMSAEDL